MSMRTTLWTFRKEPGFLYIGNYEVRRMVVGIIDILTENESK